MTVELNEGQRQLLLLALAHLAVARPGWNYACHEIALKADAAAGPQSLFERFKDLAASAPAENASKEQKQCQMCEGARTVEIGDAGAGCIIVERCPECHGTGYEQEPELDAQGLSPDMRRRGYR